jgi:F0F1-type ATP synthase assembly protein I
MAAFINIGLIVFSVIAFAALVYIVVKVVQGISHKDRRPKRYTNTGTSKTSPFIHAK